MALASPQAARDEIFALLKAAWDLSAETLTVMRGYNGTDFDRPQARGTGSEATPWMFAVIQHLPAETANANLGPAGSRRFNYGGVLIVQHFGPATDGLQKCHKLARVTKEATEGAKTAGGVFFRRVSVQEQPRDGDWGRVDVVAPFEYDTVR